MTKYSYSLSGDIYSGNFDSREEAFDAGAEEAKSWGISQAFTVYTGVSVQPKLDFKSMAGSVLDDAVQQADDSDPDDYSAGWPVSFDLAGLAKTIEKWFAEEKIELPYFIINDIEERQVEVNSNNEQ